MVLARCTPPFAVLCSAPKADLPNLPLNSRSPRGSPVGVRSQNRRQIGRPETIESVFYMWRITGDRKWQDEGWKMFVKWVQHAITESGL